MFFHSKKIPCCLDEPDLMSGLHFQEGSWRRLWVVVVGRDDLRLSFKKISTKSLSFSLLGRRRDITYTYIYICNMFLNGKTME